MCIEISRYFCILGSGVNIKTEIMTYSLFVFIRNSHLSIIISASHLISGNRFNRGFQNRFDRNNRNRWNNNRNNGWNNRGNRNRNWRSRSRSYSRSRSPYDRRQGSNPPAKPPSPPPQEVNQSSDAVQAQN